MNAKYNTNHADRVRKGIAYLDDVKPGWEANIPAMPEDFTVNDVDAHIGTLIYGSWEDFSAAFYHSGRKDMFEYGFTLGRGVDVQEYTALENEWRIRITHRMEDPT